jgi:ribonuclease HI
LEASGLPEVTVYTDGACLGNPGPGGYGAILLHGDKRKELSGGYARTTNNRMEIMACIAALEALRKPCHVTLYSDSQYVVNAMEQGWAARWKARGWKRTGNETAVNPDLWERLLALCSLHQVDFRWVRGHNGNRENERCDRLAVSAAALPGLPPDSGYR